LNDEARSPVVGAMHLGAMHFDVMRVVDRLSETEDTVTLTLGGSRPFEPGQFNMLYAFGVGEVPISVSGPADRSDVLVHTLRRVGAVTEALGRLGPGDSIGVRGPYGTPWPVSAAVGKHLILVAGGIGLAPLRPVVYHALSRPAAYRRVSLLYGARSPDQMLFRAELEQWQRAEGLECQVTVDRGDPGYDGNTGVVTKLVERLEIEPSQAIAMLCGPEVMMRFAARELIRRGLSRRNLYLSAERNMKCATGFCGHCQLGPLLLCQHGPVVSYDRLAPLLSVPEL